MPGDGSGWDPEKGRANGASPGPALGADGESGSKWKRASLFSFAKSSNVQSVLSMNLLFTAARLAHVGGTEAGQSGHAGAPGQGLVSWELLLVGSGPREFAGQVRTP